MKVTNLKVYSLPVFVFLNTYKFRLLFLVLFFSAGLVLCSFSQPLTEPDTGIVSLHMHNGLLFMSGSHYTDAIKSFDTVISYNPEHYQARLKRADCYMGIGSYAKAKADINYLYRHNKDDRSLIKARAKVYYAMQAYQDAKVALDIYVEKVPDDPEGWYLLGLVEKNEGSYRTALYHLDKANKMYGGQHYESLTVMGNVYKNKKEYERAEEQYRLAIKADSTKGLPYYLLGDVSLLQKDTLLALDYFDTAISINANDAQVMDLVTRSLTDIGYIDIAVAKYKAQIKADPSGADAWFNLGVFYLYAERYQEALDCFDHARRIDPAQSQFLYYKGITLLNMNRREEGKACIVESAEMGNYHAQQYLSMPAKTALQTMVLVSQVLYLLKL